MGAEYLLTNASDAEVDNSDFAWDSNVGWSKDNFAATFQSWMWKRHAGFDVVAYQGNQTSGRDIAHSLSKTPEMIWIKNRNVNNNSWVVGHKGLHGGTDPWDYSMVLNDTLVEADNVIFDVSFECLICHPVEGQNIKFCEGMSLSDTQIKLF